MDKWNTLRYIAPHNSGREYMMRFILKAAALLFSTTYSCVFAYSDGLNGAESLNMRDHMADRYQAQEQDRSRQEQRSRGFNAPIPGTVDKFGSSPQPTMVYPKRY